MGEGIRIVVRGDPGSKGVKGRPRFTKETGVAFTPAKTRTREGVITTMVMDAMEGRPPFTGPVCFSLLAVFRIPESWSQKRKAAALAGQELPAKRPDIDNIAKIFVDSMNTIVFADDAQLVELRARKVYGAVPQTIVEVWPDGGVAA